MISSKELRQKYLEFFQSKGHTVIPSASLIPENDPTVLFTTAGMHPLVPYLLGEPHPAGKRLTDVQKCVRTVDVEAVGDNSHLTFFEMLGNWSLNDYFKKEAIEWSWEFLTSPQYLGIDKRKLAVTVFGGDVRFPHISKDEAAAAFWRTVGVSDDRIAYMPGGMLEREDNWWGPAGQTGPCGPSTEMFYWQGSSEFPPAGSNPGTDKESWLEIWNDVFMEYNRKNDTTFVPLAQKSIDTGMGLDRTIRILNGHTDIFQIDTLRPLIQVVENISGKNYEQEPNSDRAMRIVADHIRTATMIMADDRGVVPSNVDQGYVVRRLLRRAIRHGRQLGIQNSFTASVAQAVVAIFAEVYPEVARNKDKIFAELTREEEKFGRTLEKGLREFSYVVEKQGSVSGKDAFDLFQTFGFPLEMTEELALERGLTIDREMFRQEFTKHQDLSRAGAEKKFAGGLADHSDMSVRYHTATHLLHQALRKVLGEHVGQKGSNITPDRLRFDFSHAEKMTAEQLKLVADMVNEQIQKDLPVFWRELDTADAKVVGALGFFEDAYAKLGNKVKVYFVGNEEGGYFSKEICGGPHVAHTGLIGKFKISKEEAVAAGIRRIKAVVTPPTNVEFKQAGKQE